MKLIDGKQIAQEIRAEIKSEIARIAGREPGLAFVLVGDHTPSLTYVNMKKKGCEEVGIRSKVIHLPESIAEEKLIKEIELLNSDPSIDGILVQQPLPSAISTVKVVESIDPEKDVDGFHPHNLGKLMMGQKGGFIPCTPLGILKLLEKNGLSAEGKHVVVVGRSLIVGRPLAMLLSQNRPHCNATVTLAHSKTENLSAICKQADILIAAVGRPHLIRAEMVKEGAVVIDVGINRNETGHIVGDVDFENVKTIASMITPVPGGVGPMTIAMLLSNTLLSYKQR